MKNPISHVNNEFFFSRVYELAKEVHMRKLAQEVHMNEVQGVIYCVRIFFSHACVVVFLCSQSPSHRRVVDSPRVYLLTAMNNLQEKF